jgi:hypothetical protein
MPALRLSHKLFLAFALLTGVVLSLAGWSLLTTRRLTAENRAIIERVLPAVRLEIGVLDGIAALRRVEARHAVLRDPAYIRLFVERAQAVESDLGALGELVSTVDERLALASAAEQLRSYRTFLERSPGENRDGEQATRLETVAQRLYGHSSASSGGAAPKRASRGASRLVALLRDSRQPPRIACGRIRQPQDQRPLQGWASASDVARRRRPSIQCGGVTGSPTSRSRNHMADRLRELDSLSSTSFGVATSGPRSGHPGRPSGWDAARPGCCAIAGRHSSRTSG